VSTRRGERVNASHLRKMQDKTKSISKAENLHKRTSSLKGVLLEYAGTNAFNATKNIPATDN
jgi:hypothetical protein